MKLKKVYLNNPYNKTLAISEHLINETDRKGRHSRRAVRFLIKSFVVLHVQSHATFPALKARLVPYLSMHTHAHTHTHTRTISNIKLPLPLPDQWT